jgi:hypothetical protein
MPEYFVITVSFPAPFVGDQSEEYIQANTPVDAWFKAEQNYKHQCGLFSLKVYPNADAYHKKEIPLVYYLTDKAKEWIEEKGYTLSNFGYTEK